MQKVFEERFQTPRALDAPLDFLNFSVREFFPARPDWLKREASNARP